MFHSTILRKVLFTGLLTLWIISQAGTVSAGDNIWTNIGLEGEYVYALVLAPPGTLYAGTGNGVFKSVDGGATWNTAGTSLSGTPVQTLAIDLVTPTTLYAGIDGYGSDPYFGGVFKSTDGGATWEEVNTGLPDPARIKSLAIDPVTPTTLYVGTTMGSIWDGSGLFKSTDGGATWNATSLTNAPGDSFVVTISSLAVDWATPTTLYAGGVICYSGCYGSDNSVFKSTDGGMTWNATSLTITPLSLVVDPTNPNTLFAGNWISVFQSIDGGATWDLTGGWDGIVGGWPDHYVRTLAIDPLTPSTLYAGIEGNGSNPYFDGVFQSTNGGATWGPVNAGLENTDVFALVIDPANPSTLFAGTGNGVFSIENPQQLPSVLDINHTTGAPGSFFTITGSRFRAGQTITLGVNGTMIGTVVSDEFGNLPLFLIHTDQADEGRYILTAKVFLSAQPGASAMFDLDSGEPLRPQEGDGPIFDIPGGIAYTHIIYLPLFLR